MISGGEIWNVRIEDHEKHSTQFGASLRHIQNDAWHFDRVKRFEAMILDHIDLMMMESGN
jgi:hypothetical protein